MIDIETPVGNIIIEGPVSPKHLEDLDLDASLKSFRPHMQQKKALQEIASLTEGRVFIARHQDTVVGYVTFLRPDEYQRWSKPGLPEILELGGIEISTSWRKYKLASKILELAFSCDFFNDKIVISNDYYWHWDLEETGLKMWEYRNLMEKLLSSVGFDTWITDDPEIMSHPANMFSVRIGNNVKEDIRQRFKNLCILETL